MAGGGRGEKFYVADGIIHVFSLDNLKHLDSILAFELQIFKHLADTTRYLVYVHPRCYVAQLKCVSCTTYKERGGSEPVQPLPPLRVRVQVALSGWTYPLALSLNPYQRAFLYLCCRLGQGWWPCASTAVQRIAVSALSPRLHFKMLLWAFLTPQDTRASIYSPKNGFCTQLL